MYPLKFALIFIFAAVFVVACTGAGTGGNTQTVKTDQDASALNAASNPATSATPDELAAARELYAKNCVNCHSENGEGGLKEIEGEKIKVPSFKNPKVAKEPDSEYIDKIVNGDDGMPAFKGRLTDEEVKMLVQYVRREFQGK